MICVGLPSTFLVALFSFSVASLLFFFVTLFVCFLVRVVPRVCPHCDAHVSSPPQAEIVTALQAQSNVEPSLTCLVWQKLQEQNPHFFHVYDYYLRLKDHATAFNYLVEQQALIQNDLTPDGPSKKKVVEVDITQ